MVIASGRARNWTVPRVENAVKAAFFGKGVELDKAEDEISLRYTDLKRIVGAAEGAVADKTLSRALGALVRKGQLVRHPQGREVFYRLSIPQFERVAALAKTDSDAIQSAARVGAMGDWNSGWGYYGVPDLVKERLRARLGRASKHFRSEVADTIDRLTDETIRGAVRKAQGRMARRDLWQVEDGLYRVLQTQATGALALVRGALLWSSLETVIPGSVAAFRRAKGITDPPQSSGGWTDAHADAFAKAIGAQPEEIRSLVAKESRKLEKFRPILGRFFEILGPDEGDRFGRQLNAIVTLVANLTAVTRV